MGQININIRISRQEVMNDVADIAHLEGTVVGNGLPATRLIFDVDQEENDALVTRVLSLVYTELREMLYPYTKATYTGEQIKAGLEYDNTLKPMAEYVYKLTVNDDVSYTSMERLRELLHWFMVWRILMAWYGTIAPALAQKYAASVAEAETNIKSAINHRTKPIRRKQHIF